jgi:hypothetical protein
MKMTHSAFFFLGGWGGMKMVIFALLSHACHNIELNKNMRVIISPKKCEKKVPKVQCLVCETRYINIINHMMYMMRYPYINNAVPKVTPWPEIPLNRKK